MAAFLGTDGFKAFLDLYEQYIKKQLFIGMKYFLKVSPFSRPMVLRTLEEEQLIYMNLIRHSYENKEFALLILCILTYSNIDRKMNEEDIYQWIRIHNMFPKEDLRRALLSLKKFQTGLIKCPPYIIKALEDLKGTTKPQNIEEVETDISNPVLLRVCSYFVIFCKDTIIKTVEFFTKQKNSPFLHLHMLPQPCFAASYVRVLDSCEGLMCSLPLLIFRNQSELLPDDELFDYNDSVVIISMYLDPNPSMITKWLSYHERIKASVSEIPEFLDNVLSELGQRYGVHMRKLATSSLDTEERTTSLASGSHDLTSTPTCRKLKPFQLTKKDLNILREPASAGRIENTRIQSVTDQPVPLEGNEPSLNDYNPAIILPSALSNSQCSSTKAKKPTSVVSTQKTTSVVKKQSTSSEDINILREPASAGRIENTRIQSVTGQPVPLEGNEPSLNDYHPAIILPSALSNSQCSSTKAKKPTSVVSTQKTTSVVKKQSTSSEELPRRTLRRRPEPNDVDHPGPSSSQTSHPNRPTSVRVEKGPRRRPKHVIPEDHVSPRKIKKPNLTHTASPTKSHVEGKLLDSVVIIEKLKDNTILKYVTDLPHSAPTEPVTVTISEESEIKSNRQRHILGCPNEPCNRGPINPRCESTANLDCQSPKWSNVQQNQCSVDSSGQKPDDLQDGPGHNSQNSVSAAITREGSSPESNHERRSCTVKRASKSPQTFRKPMPRSVKLAKEGSSLEDSKERRLSSEERSGASKSTQSFRKPMPKSVKLAKEGSSLEDSKERRLSSEERSGASKSTQSFRKPMPKSLKLAKERKSNRQGNVIGCLNKPCDRSPTNPRDQSPVTPHCQSPVTPHCQSPVTPRCQSPESANVVHTQCSIDSSGQRPDDLQDGPGYHSQNSVPAAITREETSHEDTQERRSSSEEHSGGSKNTQTFQKPMPKSVEIAKERKSSRQGHILGCPNELCDRSSINPRDQSTVTPLCQFPESSNVLHNQSSIDSSNQGPDDQQDDPGNLSQNTDLAAIIREIIGCPINPRDEGTVIPKGHSSVPEDQSLTVTPGHVPDDPLDGNIRSYLLNAGSSPEETQESKRSSEEHPDAFKKPQTFRNPLPKSLKHTREVKRGTILKTSEPTFKPECNVIQSSKSMENQPGCSTKNQSASFTEGKGTPPEENLERINLKEHSYARISTQQFQKPKLKLAEKVEKGSSLKKVKPPSNADHHFTQPSKSKVNQPSCSTNHAVYSSSSVAQKFATSLSQKKGTPPEETQERIDFEEHTNNSNCAQEFQKLKKNSVKLTEEVSSSTETEQRILLVPQIAVGSEVHMPQKPLVCVKFKEGKCSLSRVVDIPSKQVGKPETSSTQETASSLDTEEKTTPLVSGSHDLTSTHTCQKPKPLPAQLVKNVKSREPSMEKSPDTLPFNSSAVHSDTSMAEGKATVGGKMKKKFVAHCAPPHVNVRLDRGSEELSSEIEQVPGSSSHTTPSAPVLIDVVDSEDDGYSGYVQVQNAQGSRVKHCSSNPPRKVLVGDKIVYIYRKSPSKIMTPSTDLSRPTELLQTCGNSFEDDDEDRAMDVEAMDIEIEEMDWKNVKLIKAAEFGSTLPEMTQGISGEVECPPPPSKKQRVVRKVPALNKGKERAALKKAGKTYLRRGPISHEEQEKMELYDRMREAILRNDTPTFFHYLRISRGQVHTRNKANPETLLHVAARLGHVLFAKWLLKCGAVLEAKDGYGCTPLMTAAKNGRNKMIIFLLNCGADIEAESIFKTTALQLAIVQENLSTVRLLLKCGAQVNRTDSDHWTAISYAKNRNNMEIVALLKAHQRV